MDYRRRERYLSVAEWLLLAAIVGIQAVYYFYMPSFRGIF